MPRQTKPNVNLRCPANIGAGPYERIVEFSYVTEGLKNKLYGGLISLRGGENGLTVEVYRCDPGVRVLVGDRQDDMSRFALKPGFTWGSRDNYGDTTWHVVCMWEGQPPKTPEHANMGMYSAVRVSPNLYIADYPICGRQRSVTRQWHRRADLPPKGARPCRNCCTHNVFKSGE